MSVPPAYLRDMEIMSNGIPKCPLVLNLKHMIRQYDLGVLVHLFLKLNLFHFPLLLCWVQSMQHFIFVHLVTVSTPYHFITHLKPKHCLILLSCLSSSLLFAPIHPISSVFFSAISHLLSAFRQGAQTLYNNYLHEPQPVILDDIHISRAVCLPHHLSATTYNM